MISVIQLVTHGQVSVDGEVIAAIDRGIVALVGLEKEDTEKEAALLFKKIMNYRIFPDALGKSNLSLADVQGGLLLVPQFTLVAETSKGNRPGYSTGMPPAQGTLLFDQLVAHAQAQYPFVASGRFGANMQVSLCNDGPMTFYFKL